MLLLVLFVTYQVAQCVALPFLLLYLLKRRLTGKETIGNLRERLGFVPLTTNKKKETIWIHAVSVGEVFSVQNLIERLTRERNASIYLTTGTSAAKKLAKKHMPTATVSFVPYDLLVPMLLCFKRIRPSTLMIVEAEIWPNLLILSHWFGIPLYSVNARIPKRSEERYLRFKRIYSLLFSLFKTIYVQAERDRDLFKIIGLPAEKLEVLGNIKAANVLVKKNALFQPAEQIETTQKNESEETVTILAGSIHPGELDVHLTLFSHLKHRGKKVKMILAPRHFTWKDDLFSKISHLKVNVVSWEDEGYFSHQEEGKKPLTLPSTSTYETCESLLKENDILLVCVLGKLFEIYQNADLFILGGTFVPIGGHNLLEPAVWGIPSVVGPFHNNCKDIADALLHQNALVKANDMTQLCQSVEQLLNNPERLRAMGDSAYEWLTHEAGRVTKNIDQLVGKNL